MSNQSGKGSRPRNNFSKEFRDNFSKIDWHRPVFCPSCKNEIQKDLCWCGDDIKAHGIGCGHSPVPLGCECFRAK